MEPFKIASGVGRTFSINIEEAGEVTDSLVRTLIEIDLQTFSESTYSNYTARVFLSSGRVFLLKAEGVVIGTCVCTRSWERPNEALLLTMGIRPGWRGRGLGHKFFEGVSARLEKKGLRAINLLVSRDNRRALRIYQDTGFEVVMQRSPDARTGETFIMMRKALTVASPVTELPVP